MRPIYIAIAGMVLAAGAVLALRPDGDELAADLAQAKTQPAAPLNTTGAPQDLDQLLTLQKHIGMSQLAGQDWAVACLSRGDRPAPEAMTACWPAQAERNLGGSFVNVVSRDGTCGQWRTAKPVIDRRFQDTLCLARADVPQLSLRDAGRIVDIE